MSEPLNRDVQLARIRDRTQPWDLVVIGGGATGAAIALDASTRGMDVVLLDKSDFGKGTSSRSTKLVHGGVRYLRQGNITLVRDALKERTILRTVAPHLVHDMPFLIPCRNLWQRFFYGSGLKLYDALAPKNPFGRSRQVSATEAKQIIPTLSDKRNSGGVLYHDGQFDDSRLLINMVQTAAHHGACVVNYCSTEGFLRNNQSQLRGVIAVDQETLETHHVEAKCVINAAGPFGDEVRRMDDPECEQILMPSQGVHLVLPNEFLPGETALIVPKTSDGRVIFIIPWHGRAIVGTTDTPIPKSTLEPEPTTAEIAFLLETLTGYLSRSVTLDDVLSVFTGIRPLVKGDKSARTASLSRDHVIRESDSGLVTITGGKWTTVRKMAEDCVDHVISSHGLAETQPCRTETLPIHGAVDQPLDDERNYYGSDLSRILEMEQSDPGSAARLSPSLPIRKSDIIWAVREEMARSLDDVLSRRSRCLLLNANATVGAATRVAEIMAIELNRDEAWQREQLMKFQSIAQHYLPPSSLS